MPALVYTDASERTYQLDADGGRLYVGRQDRVDVLDITSPSSPVRIGGLDGIRLDVWAEAPYLINGTEIYDFTHPDVPGPFDELTTVELGPIHDLLAMGPYVHVGGLAGFTTIDGSDPTDLEIVGTTEVDGEATQFIGVGEQRLLVGTENPPVLRVFDVSDPSAPMETAARGLGDEGAVDRFSIDGSDLFVLTSDALLRHVDVSDPDAPIVDAPVEMPDTNGLAHRDGVLYTTGGTTVTVYDVNDPATPVYLREVDAGVTGQEIRLIEGRLYVGGRDLVILDVSSPRHPVVVSTLPISEIACLDLDVVGEIAIFLSVEGVTFVDVSNYFFPQVVATLGGGPAWKHLTVSGCTFFTALSLFSVYAYPVHQTGSVSVPEVGTAPWAPVAHPNPFRSLTRIDLEGRSGAVEVYDVGGRRIRTLAPTPGQRDAVWDGRAEDGRLAAPGMYWLRVGDGRASRVVRLD